MEIRNNQAIIEGYVNAVERESNAIPSIRGKFIEKVKQGTFKKALQQANDVELRFNHNKKLGSVKNGNLSLKEDNIGLYAKAVVDDVEVIKSAKNGELRGWSFGFVKNKDSWSEENGVAKRTLEDITLNEVSILTKMPAYMATSIEIRGENEMLIETRTIPYDAEIITNEEETRDDKPIDYSIYDNIIKMRKAEML